MLSQIDLRARFSELRNQECCRVIANGMGIAIADFDAENGLTITDNFSRYKICDRLYGDWQSLADNETTHPSDVGALAKIIEDGLVHKRGSEAYVRLVLSDGSYQASAVRLDIMCFSPGRERLLLSVREADRYTGDNHIAERYRLLLDNTCAMTFDYDIAGDVIELSVYTPDGRRDYVSERYSRCIGTSGRVAPDSIGLLREALRMSASIPGKGVVECRANYGGEYRWYRISYVSVADDAGRVSRVVGRADDIEDEIVRREEIRMRARTDAASRLLNRYTAQSSIEQELRLIRGKRLDAVFLVDLGSCADDDLLMRAGAVVRSLFRNDDIAGRYSDNQFIVYMRSFSDIQLPLTKAEQLENEMLKRGMNCAVGATLVRSGTNSFEHIVDRAEKALRLAKAKNSGRVVYDIDAMLNNA